MGRAKEIKVKVIPARLANDFIIKNHYSGKIVQNSSLHFGAFLDGFLHGVLSFGSPMDKRKVINLVEGTKWNEMLELNRMALDEYLPKNSESRVISISIKLIKKNAPHIKWILSFADATQCGDGTIYRASGFKLVGIKKNKTILEFPDGYVVSNLTLTRPCDIQSRKRVCQRYGIKFVPGSSLKPFLDYGAKFIDGYMLKYVYLIHKNLKLNAKELNYSEINKINAGMYKGNKRAVGVNGSTSCNQQEGGGSIPTAAL